MVTAVRDEVEDAAVEVVPVRPVDAEPRSRRAPVDVPWVE